MPGPSATALLTVGWISGRGRHPSESKEMRSLAKRGSVDRILRAAVRGWGINDGPESELQKHFDLDSNYLPLVMLLDDETRVAASFGAAAGTPGTSPGISGQVFGDSASAFVTSADGENPMSPLPLAPFQRQVRIHLAPPRTICLADAAFSLSVFLPHDLDECHTRDFRKLRALSQMVNVNHQWFA